MSKQKYLNVYGTERMCRDHIENVHQENMADLENTYQINRLKENNRQEIERRELDIKADDHRESNRRALIDTQNRATINSIRAQGEVDEKMKRIDNERQRDKESFELNIEKERNKFKIDSKNLDYQQEINRKKADTETMKISRELDIKSQNLNEENRRKMIETEKKLKIETTKVECDFKKDITKINNEHEINLKNCQIEEEKMREEQRRKGQKVEHRYELDKKNSE